MNSLDFISESPRTFIFQKSSNKTNLGGILTLFYLMILALITFVYLFDYFKNYYNKFEINYLYNQFKDETYKEEKKAQPGYNPLTNFSFYILDNNGELVSDDDFDIILYNRKKKNRNDNKGEEIEMGEIITKRADDFYIGIMYVCPDNNCTFESIEFEDLIYKEYTLVMSYNSKLMEHNNPDSPVQDIILNYTYNFYLDDNFYGIYPKWEVFNYEEKKGVLLRMYDYIQGKSNFHSFGQINENEVQYKDLSKRVKNIICNKKGEECVKMILALYIQNPFEGIHDYKRSSVSIWDYLANIASLGTAIFNGLCKAFGLMYSRNFDNYKIIEKIITKEYKKVNKKDLVDNNNIYSDSSLENNLIDKNIEENQLNKDNSTDDDLIINDIDNLNENNIENENDKMITKLPKLRFFDFFFNNVYSKCCIYIKKQKLIDACDEVLYKYYSIENLLYNQLLFENLMKDYKWNNPKLK